MALCPCCGRLYCDHSTAERDQTVDEMMRPLSEDEQAAYDIDDPTAKLAAAIRHAHDPVPRR